LGAVVETVGAGGDLDSERVTREFERSLSASDDIIRFCVNGLVIIGLMGTLYAFYQMWGTHGTADLTAGNSTLYLESMSTALLVSLVGLLLALITNFLFAATRARRQKLLDELANFLLRFAGLVATDAKTHLLMVELLAPLDVLIKKISWQNEHMVKGLVETIDRRTQELNGLVANTTRDWQGAIGAFRSEALVAAQNLNQTTGRLDATSINVSATLEHVRDSLEHAKDLGRIVDQVETSSGKLIAHIAHQLSEATNDWIAVHALAAQSYETTLKEQSKELTKTSVETADLVRNEFKKLFKDAFGEFERLKEDLAARLSSANEKVAGSLEGFGGVFTSSVETIGAKWRTEAMAVADASCDRMNQIVSAWQTGIEGTTQHVNTSLSGSRELMEAMKISVGTLSADLEKLQRLAKSMSDVAAAPISLSEAVQELQEISTALQTLTSKMEYGQVLDRLDYHAASNKKSFGAVKERLENLTEFQQKNSVLPRQITALDEHFQRLDVKVATLSSDVGALARGIRVSQGRRASAVRLAAPLTFWQKVRQRLFSSAEGPSSIVSEDGIEDKKLPAPMSEDNRTPADKSRKVDQSALRGDPTFKADEDGHA
jgi:polyhydroxyalkanoate synthesis regulator phasin